MPSRAGEPVIRLLGEVSVVVDGRPVPAGTPKQACVLACLAWTPGRAVDADVIAERVWDGTAGSRARANLAPYVARLRRLLAPAGIAITGRAGAYTLDLDPERVDVHAMRARAAAARDNGTEPGAAAALLREALELWHGRPLSRVDAAWADTIRSTLEPERAGLWTALFDAELARGNHAAILPELSRQVRGRPEDENLIGQYMLALHRGGRGIEALECFRRTQDRFSAEFGIDVSRRLTDLRDQILAGAPDATTAEPAEAAPALLPAAPAGFVGRTAELAAADSQLALGRGAVAFVGPGGVGKTALALTWAHTVADRYPDGQLFADLRGYSGEDPVPAGRILPDFMRALGIGEADLPGGETELAGLYRTALAGRRVLVVLDNAAGPAQVRPLLPGDGDCLAVVTSRDDLRGLRIDHDAATIPVGRLPTPDAVAMLAGGSGVAGTGRDLEQLARLCGHLPLAIRLAAGRLSGAADAAVAALVAELRAGDGGVLAALSGPGEDGQVLTASIDASYRTLDPVCRQVFDLLGAHPAGGADAAALANAARRPLAEVNRGLRRIEAAHLAHRLGTRWDVHDLVREFAQARASGTDEALGRLYDWYAMALLNADGEIYGHRPELHVDTAVAVPGFDGTAAADAWMAERVGMLLAAVDAAAAGHRDHARRLLSGLWRYLWRRGMYDAWTAAQHTVLDAIGPEADPSVRCELLMGLGNAYTTAGRHDDGAVHIRAAHALAADLEPVQRARTAGALGVLLSDCGSSAEARSYLEQARDLFTEAGSDGRVAVSQYELGRLDYRDGLLAAAADRFAGAVAVWEAIAPGSVAIGSTSLGRVLARLGRVDEAVAVLDRAVASARELDNRSVESYALAILAIVELRRGRAETAWRRHRESIALTPEINHADLRVEVYNFAGVFRAEAGDPAAAIEYHHVALDLAGAAGYETARAHQGLALALAQHGDAEADRHRRAAAAGFARCGTPAPADLL